jgi:hypothetical protein
MVSINLIARLQVQLVPIIVIGIGHVIRLRDPYHVTARVCVVALFLGVIRVIGIAQKSQRRIKGQ